MKIPILNLHGTPVADLSLPQEPTPNQQIITQSVLTYQANERSAVAHTKTRGDVSGGGIKPWRQKGTGRARAGSSRSPLWRGGGITFGPRKNRFFALRLPRQMREAALQMALIEKAKQNRLVVLDKLEAESPQTKSALTFLRKLNVDDRPILVVATTLSDEIKRAFHNIPGLVLQEKRRLNPYHFLSAHSIIMTKELAQQILHQATEVKLKPKKEEKAEATKAAA